ncbi:hypothetical protein [Hanamia caeni]|jgi:hypothetical protein|uniref:hypothetical protein n=1 Tax=Hanamia caeni TaxID=2294116 RepID=UPI0013143CEA|nr:hypothetical protein [Hanamia caeni]
MANLQSIHFFCEISIAIILTNFPQLNNRCLFYILFIIYAVFFCWLITRIRFFRSTGLLPQLLVALFIVRILVMIAGCYVNLYILPVSDTVAFHNMGTDDFNLLLRNGREYFSQIFHNPYVHGYSRLFDDYHSFWNNLRTILIVKMVSIFDFFSFKDFWINSLFFNFIVFFGCAALYKVFVRVFPQSGIPLILCIFLFPSALFFSAMIHRDGLIFLAISMVVYHLYFFKKGGNIFKRIVIISLFLLLIFCLRNYVFLLLIPALMAWMLAEKFPKKSLMIFVATYFLGLLFFFLSGLISPKIDFPGYVAKRQESFIQIGKQGNSTIKVDTLKPTFGSFIKNAPQAFDLAFLRPYLSKINETAFAPFALEILLIQILLVLLIFFHKKTPEIQPIIYFNLFFSISALLIGGYVVPIIGAIVRYRSIYFIFLLIPVVCYIDWTTALQLKRKK